MTVPDEYQQLALKTWHNVDVPQDEQINHAMLQLAAEAGEVVKLWAKSRYKPGHEITREMILNEAGDLWYYMRIICYLFGITTEELTRYNADKLQGGHGWNGSSEKVMERTNIHVKPCSVCGNKNHTEDQCQIAYQLAGNTEHPDQPIYIDEHKTFRFKENTIVRFLLDDGPNDLNRLATLPFSREDRRQFAQLIGYSVSGFEELGFELE